VKLAAWIAIALAGACAVQQPPGVETPPRPDRSGPQSCARPFNAGFDIQQFGGVTAAVWYPSTDQEREEGYARNTIGSIAKGGAVNTCARFPLVVFSHGFGGCGIQSVFFTEALAREGYVVVAPDHADALCDVHGGGALRIVASEESFLNPKRWEDQTHRDRARELERTIDGALASPKFRDAILADRIGAVGHSLGGYVVLGLAGGWASWKDDRIDAALLFSPYAAPFVTHDRLDAVTIPVMYQGAEGDFGITPSLRGDSGAYGATGGPKYYLELRRGNHFIWTNLQCLNRTSAECRTRTSEARLITEYGIAFLDRYLKDEGERLEQLRGEGVRAFRRSP
jgi:predicted dienelactone hydrolase